MIVCPADQTVATDSGVDFASVALPAADSASDNSGHYRVTIDVGRTTYIVGDIVALPPAVSPYVVRYTITDGSMNSASCNIYITVVGTFPFLVLLFRSY